MPILNYLFWPTKSRVKLRHMQAAHWLLRTERETEYWLVTITNQAADMP
jgi:hypothetical protein